MKNRLIRFLGRIICILIYKQKQIEILNLRLLDNTSIDKSFYVGAHTYFNPEKGFKELTIQEGVVVKKSCNFVLDKDASLIIRSKVFINNYCSINCLGYIEIGENTMLGEGVKIYDHNHTYSYDSNNTLKIERDGFKIGSVIIGANCWIASNVTILNNVKIGDNVIIGANCLVFKDVPSNTVVKSNNNPFVNNISTN
jgi:acetyltransferase-like isoleucine patch superfamily enzyme